MRNEVGLFHFLYLLTHPGKLRSSFDHVWHLDKVHGDVRTDNEALSYNIDPQSSYAQLQREKIVTTWVDISTCAECNLVWISLKTVVVDVFIHNLQVVRVLPHQLKACSQT